MASGLNVGVIARADDRGLGTQTWEVSRHIDPAKVLVIRAPGSEAQGFTPHLDRFPGATVLTVDERRWTLPEDEVREWLDGLDVVYTAETLYDWRIADWGRDQKVATVCHANPEFYLHASRPWPEPSQWWAPTNWRLNHLPPGTVVVPMPAPTDRFTPDPDDGSTSVLHVGGRAATGDRNGTDVVLMASHLIPNITVTTQSGVRRHQRAVVTGAADNWWDLYDGHAVLLLPRRYGGLCLPIIEACAAGLVPVATNCVPNHTWPIEPIQCSPGRQVKLPGGWIDTHDCDPNSVADAVRNVLPNLPQRRRSVIQWANDNSWEALAPLWRERLEQAVVAKPRKPPSVTVIVPFSPGVCQQRDRVWAWLNARWQRLHPSWRVIEAHYDGEWCKAAAIQSVIGDVTSDVVIVADADVYMAPLELSAAVTRIASGAPWSVPWRNVRRLTETETARVMSNEDYTLEPMLRMRRHVYYEGVAGGGLVIIPRKAWDTAPMDDRFVGWGYEDISWGYALDTLVGEHVRFDADLFHLWHPPQSNCGSPSEASEALWREYQMAHRRPSRMRALVDRTEFDTAPLAEPVTFQAFVRVLKLPGSRIRFVDHRFTTRDPDLVEALRAHPEVEEVA